MLHVRFESIADMCGAARDVRFGPIADIADAQQPTSAALPDMCGAKTKMSAGSKADMCSARECLFWANHALS